MVALVLTVVFIVVVGAVAFRVWKEEDERSASSTPDKSAAVTPPSAARPETLEGALVVQLSAGAISRIQYLRAMARIAALDEERHPLAVPPDIGSPDA